VRKFTVTCSSGPSRQTACFRAVVKVLRRFAYFGALPYWSGQGELPGRSVGRVFFPSNEMKKTVSCMHSFGVDPADGGGPVGEFRLCSLLRCARFGDNRLHRDRKVGGVYLY
jgi:hypothetical protein